MSDTGHRIRLAVALLECFLESRGPHAACLGAGPRTLGRDFSLVIRIRFTEPAMNVSFFYTSQDFGTSDELKDPMRTYLCLTYQHVI